MTEPLATKSRNLERTDFASGNLNRETQINISGSSERKKYGLDRPTFSVTRLGDLLDLGHF